LGAVAVVGADALDKRGGCTMTKKQDPGALAGASGADGDRVSGEQLPDTTTARSGPIPPEPLAAIGPYQLLAWERCIPPATGRMGIATVLLPSGKLGGFGIYNLSSQFAEWWPTTLLRRDRRGDHAELNAALPFAVALVRQHDPDVLVRRSLFPVRSRTTEAGE
jgi:hypothetical protein